MRENLTNKDLVEEKTDCACMYVYIVTVYVSTFLDSVFTGDYKTYMFFLPDLADVDETVFLFLY